MFGLGKRRSRFGRFLDREGIAQEEVRQKAGIGHGTMTSMCNDREYAPRISTWVKVQRALRSLGYEVDREDYFDC